MCMLIPIHWSIFNQLKMLPSRPLGQFQPKCFSPRALEIPWPISTKVLLLRILGQYQPKCSSPDPLTNFNQSANLYPWPISTDGKCSSPDPLANFNQSVPLQSPWPISTNGKCHSPDPLANINQSAPLQIVWQISTTMILSRTLTNP